MVGPASPQPRIASASLRRDARVPLPPPAPTPSGAPPRTPAPALRARFPAWRERRHDRANTTLADSSGWIMDVHAYVLSTAARLCCGSTAQCQREANAHSLSPVPYAQPALGQFSFGWRAARTVKRTSQTPRRVAVPPGQGHRPAPPRSRLPRLGRPASRCVRRTPGGKQHDERARLAPVRGAER